MTETIFLRENRAQLVVNEMNNGTKIISEPDHDGWVKISVEINDKYDMLALYHAGQRAARIVDEEYATALKEKVA